MSQYVLVAGLIAAPAGLALLRLRNLRRTSRDTTASLPPQGWFDGGIARRVDAPARRRAASRPADGGTFPARPVRRGDGA